MNQEKDKCKYCGGKALDCNWKPKTKKDFWYGLLHILASYIIILAIVAGVQSVPDKYWLPIALVVFLAWLWFLKGFKKYF